MVSKKKQMSTNSKIFSIVLVLVIFGVISLLIINPSLTFFSINGNGDNNSGSIIDTSKKAPSNEMPPAEPQTVEGHVAAVVSSSDSSGSPANGGIAITEKKPSSNANVQSNVIVGCGPVSPGGSYSLSGNMGSGGTCLTIAADNVVIDGGGYTINGDIVATSAGNGYTGLQLSNMVITGNVDSHGANQTINNASDGGSVTLTNVNVTNVYTYGGSQTEDDPSDCYCGSGGKGGDVSLTNSNILGELKVYGGGASAGSGGVGYCFL